MNAIQNLPDLNYLDVYFVNTYQQSYTNLVNFVLYHPNLYHLYYVGYNDSQTEICNVLTHISERTKLDYLYLHFAINSISNLSCFENMFTKLVNLQVLGIIFYQNSVTSLSVFQNAFTTLSNVREFYFSGFDCPITTYGMQNSLLPMTSLKTLSFELGPAASTGIVWNNFTVYHPTLETISYYVRPYLSTSTNLFRNLPMLKRVNLTFRSTYQYSHLKFVTDQLADREHFYYFYINLHYQHKDGGNDLNIAQWSNLFTQVREKLTHFEFWEHYNQQELTLNNFSTILSDANLPNLQYINVGRNYPFPGHNFIVPQFNHSKVTQVYYYIHDFTGISSLWSAHTNLFANLPNLQYPMIYLGYCRLDNSNINGYQNLFTHLAGRTFKQFYLNIYYNNFNSWTNIANTKGSFTVKNGSYAQFYFHQNYNIVNLSGLKGVIESFVNPVGTTHLYLGLFQMGLTDASHISSAVSNYKDLVDLNIQLHINKLSDMNQFVGVLDNKPNILYFYLYTRENPINDQTVLNDMYLPTNLGGKAKMIQIGHDLESPVAAVTTLHSNMQVDGQYLSIMKFGFCISDYSMAKRFVLGSNICIECVNANCHSCVKNGECQRCRISTPQRQLPLCDCDDGYYGGADYSCLLCSSKCLTCNNGQNCLSCKNSVPKRIVPDCICPDGYYDDGINDQCATCKLGCLTCKNGISCKDCIEGYYQKGTQCLICPLHFTKCYFDQDKQEVLGLQCFGSNRYYILPYCQCIEGYYPIDNFPDCIACNTKCTECTSAKQCQACAAKYYLNAVEESCNKCKPLCKTCTNGDVCETCEDRQLDPSTSCQYTYQQAAQMQQQATTVVDEEDQTNTGSNGGSTTNNGGTTTNTDGGSTNNNNTDGGSTNNNNTDGGSTNNNNTDGGSTNNNNNGGSTNNNNGGSTNNNNGGSTTNNGGSTTNDSTVASFSMFNPITNQVEVVKCNDQNCSTCSEGICTKCIVGLNRLQAPPLCSCKQGYHDNYSTTNDCYQCHKTCFSCNSYEQCNQCRDSDFRKLNQSTLSCDCLPGFKQFNGENICRPCYQYKDECLFTCPQNTVIQENLGICSDINYEISQTSNISIYVIFGLALVVVLALTKLILNGLNFQLSKEFNQKVKDRQYQIKLQQFDNKQNLNDSIDKYHSKIQIGDKHKSSL